MDDSLPNYAYAVAIPSAWDLWRPNMLDAKGRNVTPPDGHVAALPPTLDGIVSPAAKPGCSGPYGCSWAVTAHQYRLRADGYPYQPCNGRPACLISPILAVPGGEWHLTALDDGIYHWQMSVIEGISPSAWSDETSFILDTTPPRSSRPWEVGLTRYFDSRVVQADWEALSDLSGVAHYLVAIGIDRRSEGPRSLLTRPRPNATLANVAGVIPPSATYCLRSNMTVITASESPPLITPATQQHGRRRATSLSTSSVLPRRMNSFRIPAPARFFPQ